MREKAYLIRIFKQKTWFKCAGFPAFVPRDLTAAESKTWRKATLDRKINQLRVKWTEVETHFFQILSTFRHAQLLPRYICHISRYGPEGEYRRPNMVFVRLRTKQDEIQAVETLAHELLHLSFSQFFSSSAFDYQQREGIIDALVMRSSLKELLPHYRKQSIGKEPRGLIRRTLLPESL